VTNRIKGLLVTQGVRLQFRGDFVERIDEIRLWDGSRLPPRLRDRLQREWERRAWLSKRILHLERNRRELLRSSTTDDVERVRQLLLLDGIGENSAWVFVTEFFGWRRFNNRREVGGLAGVTPANYQSWATSHDQGISKAGNRHVRHMAVQVAWAWLRHQPDSALSRWYNRKYGAGSSSLRKIASSPSPGVSSSSYGAISRRVQSPKERHSRPDRTNKERRPEERPDVCNRGPPRRPASERWGPLLHLASTDASRRTQHRVTGQHDERAGTNRRSSEASRRGPTPTTEATGQERTNGSND
jgi:hypothetical protein